MKWVVFAALVAAIPAAIIFRRRIDDSDSELGRWFQERARPKLKDAVMLVFVATFLLWAVVYVSAPDDSRDDLGEAMKSLWQSITGDSDGTGETK